MLLLIDKKKKKKKKHQEKHHKESQGRRNFESERALFVICARVTTLHSCYIRMHSFSANQKRVIF